MLEKIATALSALMPLVFLAVGLTKNEFLMALFLTLMAVTMGCWGVHFYREYKTASAKKAAAKPAPEKKKPAPRPEITFQAPDAKAYCVLTPDPEGKREYTLTLYKADGSIQMTQRLQKEQRVFVFSGLALYLKTKGWPLWVLEALYRKNCLQDFCSDQGEMPVPGRVHWECRHDYIYFEKKNGQWAVHSEKERFSTELPDATDEQIVQCLQKGVGVLWEHQADFADFVTGKEPPKPLLDVRHEEGRLTVHPADSEGGYLIEHFGILGHSEHQIRVPAKQYTQSGLLFILTKRGWPQWTLQALEQWKKGLTAITHDEAVPERKGYVYWQNEGDLSRRYDCLCFEKPLGQPWRLCCFSNAPGIKKQYYPLPEAADEDIIRYLSLSPHEAFWNHPRIREQMRDDWAYTHQTRPYQDSKALEEIMNTRLFKKLDPALAALGMDRETFMQNVFPYSRVRFTYSVDKGYRLIATPNYNPQIKVLCQGEDEDAFCAKLTAMAEAINRRGEEEKTRKQLLEKRNALAHYRMSDEEKSVCLKMEKKLDALLQSMGADRAFIQARTSSWGSACFGYAEGQGYYYRVQPERSDAVVPFLISDEEAFLARMLREAVDYQDRYPGDSVLLTLKYTWGGRMEHGEERLVLIKKAQVYYLNLFSWHWNDAAEAPSLTGVTCRCAGRLEPADLMRWRPSGYLFHQKVMGRLPHWAMDDLLKENVFTKLFLPPAQEEKTGRVYWFNAGEWGQEYWVVWFEKHEGKWQAHIRVKRPDVRMDQVMPLPEADDRDIAELLTADIGLFLANPLLTKWYKRDETSEITLYERKHKLAPDEELHARYAIDTRCGALYCYETGLRAGKTRQTRRRADYSELANQDVRYEGMYAANWQNYLPDRLQNDAAVSKHLKRKAAARSMIGEAEASFSDADRKRFKEQLYQYSQDTGRDGRTPEEAAANRGLVFVNGAPVAREVAQRMEEMATEKNEAVTAENLLYQHKRVSFYDEEVSVRLTRKAPEAYNVLVLWNTPNMGDHTVYDLPLMLTDTGCTRGGILTWLKEQGCVINFPREALTDETQVIPAPKLLLRPVLPAESFGKRVKVIKDTFHSGSASRHSVALHRKNGADWLVITAYWRDEHDGARDISAEMAVRGAYQQRKEESLLKLAERHGPGMDHGRLFEEVRVYHDDADMRVYGEAERELYRWNSFTGHDSQSWNHRLHTLELHRRGDRRYVIEKLLFIDGSTRKEKWITTVARLSAECDLNDPEKIRAALDSLPARSPD